MIQNLMKLVNYESAQQMKNHNFNQAIMGSKRLLGKIRTDLTTAELIKYANNTFLATKISFINSDCCILLTDWNVYRKLTPNKFKKMNKPNVIDVRRILSPKKFSAINFKAIGLGN